MGCRPASIRRLELDSVLGGESPISAFPFSIGSHPNGDAVGLECSSHRCLKFTCHRLEISCGSQSVDELRQSPGGIGVTPIEAKIDQVLYTTSHRISQGSYPERRGCHGQITLCGCQLTEQENQGGVKAEQKNG
jgi:hypothetical protein